MDTAGRAVQPGPGRCDQACRGTGADAMSARAVVAALPHRIRVEAPQRFERMKQDGLSDGGFVLVRAWNPRPPGAPAGGAADASAAAWEHRRARPRRSTGGAVRPLRSPWGSHARVQAGVPAPGPHATPPTRHAQRHAMACEKCGTCADAVRLVSLVVRAAPVHRLTCDAGGALMSSPGSARRVTASRAREEVLRAGPPALISTTEGVSLWCRGLNGTALDGVTGRGPRQGPGGGGGPPWPGRSSSSAASASAWPAAALWSGPPAPCRNSCSSARRPQRSWQRTRARSSVGRSPARRINMTHTRRGVCPPPR